MGISKTHLFPKEINEKAEIHKALGHPARLAIILYLSQQKDCICNDVVDQIKLAQPTISRHLSVLKKAGLIQGTISGPNLCYCINPKTLELLKTSIQSIQLSNEKTSCCK